MGVITNEEWARLEHGAFVWGLSSSADWLANKGESAH